MKDTNIITSELYPLVKTALDKNSKKFLDNIAKFINKRHKELFDIAPYDRIYFNKDDVDDIFRALGFTERDVINIVKKSFFWDMPGLNPRCLKEPYVLVLLCCIRYYLLKPDRKNAELTTIYLAFSGKIYASLHAYFWKFPPRNSQSVMDYVINNMLSDKFDLKKEGSIFKAVQKLCITWLTTYENDIKKCDSDDDWKLYLQQLRDRVKSFLKNIADLFFQASEEKLYLNYEVDSLDTDSFRLTDNDAARAARITESTMSILTSQKVDLNICNMCKNENVGSLEIKDIIESILSDTNNLQEVRRVVNIIICDYMQSHPNKRIGTTDFISYTLKAKPNTKSEMLLEMKRIILTWLDENSPTYRKRKSRIATANNYYKSILGYFTLIITKVSNNI